MIDDYMPKRKLDPLPAAAFQILLALADGELHGYAIMRQVEEQSAGRVRLGPGTLYSSIQALVEEGLIEEVDPGEKSESLNERRRYYRITSNGRKLARSEAEKLADLLRVARAKNILRGEYV
jgi:DNA-binding PadR family transcriptional regulator